MPALRIGDMIEMAGHARPNLIRRNRCPPLSRLPRHPNPPGLSPPLHTDEPWNTANRLATRRDRASADSNGGNRRGARNRFGREFDAPKTAAARLCFPGVFPWTDSFMPLDGIMPAPVWKIRL